MNIVTLHAEGIPDVIAQKYTLVPQQHNEQNKWYKIVVMDHVEVEHLSIYHRFKKRIKCIKPTCEKNINCFANNFLWKK